ncbi:MAG: hypothetical protein KGR48_01335 [Alphaproteobacteria bacterium]|nr:hypothetical protein [Alphaproteobacteria bacterium]MDE2012660.1 hypothetical protein [Alphaproteobacteria bacterium]
MRTNKKIPSGRVDDIAALLSAARMSSQFLDHRTAFPHLQDLREAHDIQCAAFALRHAPVAAYKIGLTNVDAQQAIGAGEPVAGRLAADDLIRSPARIRAPHHLRIVEAEIVFEIGKDLPGSSTPYARSDILSAISSVYAGIEICNSRFGPEDVSLLHLVADNSNADRLVLGDRLSGLRPVDLADLPVTLACEGRPVVSGSSARVLGDPVASVAWLANWLATCGEALKRGQFVASGSCTGVTEVDVGQTVVARFGEFGAAQAVFVPIEDEETGL